MRIGLLGLLGCLMGVCVHAQDLLLMGSDSSYREETGLLQVWGAGGFGSNALTNAFAQKALLGGKISREDKAEVSRDLRESNRSGGHASLGVSYRSFADTLFGQSLWGLDLAVSHHVDFFAGFSEDLYRTAFEGNAAFIGKTAVFDQSRSQYQVFQKFGVGLFNRTNFSGFRISVVNGQAFQDIVIDEGGLYTSANVDTLQLSYQGAYQRSDTAHAALGSGNGIGVAFDGIVNLPLSQGKGLFRLAVHNLGWVQWSDASMEYTADTSFTWTGIDLDAVIDEGDGFSGIPALEDTLYYSVDSKATRLALPTRLEVAVLHRAGESNYWEAGIEVRPNAVHIPLIRGGWHHFLTDRNKLYAQVRWGGYGNLGIGAGYSHWHGPFFASLDISDVPALALRNLHGTSIRLALGWFFKGHHE